MMQKNDEMLDLHNVLTISEAAKMFHVLPSTIMYHIDRGNISARKTLNERGVWLISRSSLARYYSQTTVQNKLETDHNNG